MKTNIKKILIPTDFTPTSEVAVMQGAHLAKKMGAELHLLHVLEVPFQAKTGKLRFPITAPQVKSIKKKTRDQLEMLQNTIFVDDMLLTWNHIRRGNVETAILDFVQNENIDLIIMGTHGASGYKELILGSNTQKVVSKSKIPVLTFKSGEVEIQFKNILFPIDNSLRSREKMNAIIEIAKAYDSTIHIIGVTEEVTRDTIKKLVLKMESVEDYLDAKQLKHELKIMPGLSLAKAAMDYVNDHHCDLIVVNDNHESNFKGFIGGVFPKKIINHSNIPVLTAKVTEGYYETPSFIGYGNPMRY